MDLNQLQTDLGQVPASSSSASQTHKTCLDNVSLETEVPEALYMGMKEFLGANPHWDQYTLLSSALANFLFQNGCQDRAVTERYLNDLFSRHDA